MRKEDWFKVAMIVGAVFLAPFLVYAESGACSSHGGVNCDYGRDSDGSVVCNDGWKQSSTEYEYTSKCQNRYYCETESDYSRLQTDLYRWGTMQYSPLTADGFLQSCRNSINEYQSQNITPKSYKSTPTFETKKDCPMYSTLKSDGYCYCQEGYRTDPLNKSVCISNFNYCKRTYGDNSTDFGSTCGCINYHQWNSNKTACVLSTNQSTPPITQPKPIVQQPTLLGIQTSNPLGLMHKLLIKNKKYNDVFFVDENLCLRWVINEKVAEKHFGKRWWQGIKEFDGIPKEYKFCDNLI